MQLSTDISVIQLGASFVIGSGGAVVGAVLTAFRVDKRIALLEQRIEISIDGEGGVIKRLANIEAAMNARRNSPDAIS